MTVSEVRKAIKEIKNTIPADCERAHGMHVSLYEDVLNAIAKNECDDPLHLADAAIKAAEIKFPW